MVIVLLQVQFILDLQGGSGVGHGNFLEIGPQDVNLKPRQWTWLKVADLIFVVRNPEHKPLVLFMITSMLFLSFLFVNCVICVVNNVGVCKQDAPVGVGFSYPKSPGTLVTTDDQAVEDLAALVEALLEEGLPTLRRSPLYIVGESYGGKFAAMLGVVLSRAIRKGTLKLTLGGVVLGDAWISPADYSVSKINIFLCIGQRIITN